MATAEPMVADLRAESDELDALVADLPAARWADPTPAPGWTIAHQIAHLLWTDRVALVGHRRSRLRGGAERAAADPTGFVDAGAEELAVAPPPSCWPTGARPGPGCTTNCWPSPTAASCRGSARR